MNRRQFLIASTASAAMVSTFANSQTATRPLPLIPMTDLTGGIDGRIALAAAWGNVCGNGAMGINGQPMNMERIDEEVNIGDTELWRITVEDQLHPFHIHGCSFRILSQQGATPPSYAQGWKDMVHVEEGWSEVLIKFEHRAPTEAPYMYHCHILEHEDCGMMGQFTVT